MHESLVQKFLEEDVEDLNYCMVRYGIQGVLERFEYWLKQEEIIPPSQG